MRHLPTRKIWLRVGLPAIFAAILWAPIQNAINVTAVQSVLEGDFEISFDDAPGPLDKPVLLPSPVDAAAKSFFRHIYPDSRDIRGNRNTKVPDPYINPHERFRALFRGSIQRIQIYGAFHGDLGAALSRFPELRDLSVSDLYDDGPTEAEWTRFCGRLLTIPNLERLEIGGSWLTDAAIAPLAHHQGLRDISISHGRLTPECTKTFAAMPHLTGLKIENQTRDGDISWVSANDRKAMEADLPGVNLGLSWREPPASTEPGLIP